MLRTPFRLDMDNSAFKEALIAFSKNGMTLERYDKPLDKICRIVDESLGKTFLELPPKNGGAKDASSARK